MDEENPSLVKTYGKITAVVATYWVVSIALVFVNKYLLSSSDLKLDAPMFVTWFQCIVTVALCVFLSTVSALRISMNSVTLTLMKQVAPLSLVFVGMIAFNNMCLKYVDVSFYYIGRSLTTVFNVVLSYTVLGQTTSSAAVTCCGIIVGGFFLGVDQEHVTGSLSIPGVTFGVLASLFVALYSIYIKKVLPSVNNDVVLLTFYNNLNACFLFLPLIMINGEMGSIFAFDKLTSVFFWSLMVLGGVFGFAIGFLISLQVKVTSPLTNNISGTAKACAQTVLATLWYQEAKPALWWTSNGVVLLGSAAYTRVRQLEMQREHALKQATDDSNRLPA